MAAKKKRQLSMAGWERLEREIISISLFSRRMAAKFAGLTQDAARKRLEEIRDKGTFSDQTRQDIAETLGVAFEELVAKVNPSARAKRPTKTAAKPSKGPLKRYLEAVIREHAPLRLKAIDQGAAKPGTEPLQLKQIYVELDLQCHVPKRSSLREIAQLRQNATLDNAFDVPTQDENGGDASMRELEAKALTWGDRRIGDLTRVVTGLEAIGYHDRLVLLGPPGSGKSTITAMLALTLAEASLLPKAKQAEGLKRLGKWWETGALVPVRVTLRQFGAWLPKDVEQGRAGHLWSFIEQDLKDGGLGPEEAGVPRRAAESTGAMFLLDGLDEVRDEATRARMLEAVAEFARTAGPGCRFLITARPYAWEAFKDARTSAKGSTPAELAEMHASYTLAEFGKEQIETFIDRWYRAIDEAGWPVSAATKKSEELKQVVWRDDLRVLAANPLLLTLMATLHSNRARLPDDRADLYHEVVDLLLQRWNEQSGASRGLLDALRIDSLRLGHLREVMQALAFDAHAAHAGKAGVADIPEGDLVAALKPLLANDAGKADLALHYVEERAGLLLGQGERGKQRQYSFPHRTFQEYLAACHLADRADFCDAAARLARENPAHWREVLVLAARQAGKGRGVPAANALIHCRSHAEHTLANRVDDSDWRAAVLAARQILEIGKASVESLPHQKAVLDHVAGWLAALLAAGALPVKERAEAGDLLAKLGDPRPGTGLRDGVPDIDWIEIPAGSFLAGDRRKTRIDEPYRISRYPVTVAQFAAFVRAGGYEEGGRRFWSRDGWDWRQSNSIRGPEDYRAEFLVDNHPRVGVSWYEAEAFCRWLGAVRNEPIQLPLPDQWERAARHTDGREFPWGDDAESLAERCNSDGAQIGSTSAVGMFPTGNAVCGAADLAGNVWEWCGQPANSSDSARVLRGGSWGDARPDFFRCARRLHYDAGDRDYNIGFRCVRALVSARAVAAA